MICYIINFVFFAMLRGLCDPANHLLKLINGVTNLQGTYKAQSTQRL